MSLKMIKLPPLKLGEYEIWAENCITIPPTILSSSIRCRIIYEHTLFEVPCLSYFAKNTVYRVRRKI